MCSIEASEGFKRVMDSRVFRSGSYINLVIYGRLWGSNEFQKTSGRFQEGLR